MCYTAVGVDSKDSDLFLDETVLAITELMRGETILILQIDRGLYNAKLCCQLLQKLRDAGVAGIIHLRCNPRRDSKGQADSPWRQYTAPLASNSATARSPMCVCLLFTSHVCVFIVYTYISLLIPVYVLGKLRGCADKISIWLYPWGKVPAVIWPSERPWRLHRRRAHLRLPPRSARRA